MKAAYGQWHVVAVAFITAAKEEMGKSGTKSEKEWSMVSFF